MQNATDYSAVRRLWWQWTEVVELIAHGRHGRVRLEPAEYAQLHADLVAACRALVGAAEGPSREFCQTLLDTAKPWVTLYALEKGTPEILRDLSRRCRLAERKLGGRPWRTLLRSCAVPALALLVGAGAVLLVVRINDWSYNPMLEWVKGWLIAVRWYITKSEASPMLVVAGGALALVAIYLISRAVRK